MTREYRRIRIALIANEANRSDLRFLMGENMVGVYSILETNSGIAWCYAPRRLIGESHAEHGGQSMSLRRPISRSPIGLRAEFRTGTEIPKAEVTPPRIAQKKKVRKGKALPGGVKKSPTTDQFEL